MEEQKAIDELALKMDLTNGHSRSKSAIMAAMMTYGLFSRSLNRATRDMSTWGAAANQGGRKYFPKRSRKTDKQKRKNRVSKLSRRKNRK